MRDADTIFALASGAGRAAIAIIRISGPGTPDLLRAMLGRLPDPRQATLATLGDMGGEGHALDRGLVLWFPGPASFTGEDAAELHLHGGRAVVAAALRALAAQEGCRPAEPGEFTRRAFRNGKMDLAAVEGLADLIDAQTEAQRRQALRHLEGALTRWVDDLRDRLLDALAITEAAIDFSDEDDVGSALGARGEGLVAGILALIDGELRAAGAGARLREGMVVAIAGPPNAGKSTLLNALAGRDVAIVSVHAGTTRDPIEVELELGGYPVVLVDTAGLRDTLDPVEEEGIARARARALSADLVLLLDSGEGRPPSPVATLGRVWTVATKADRRPHPTGAHDLLVSSRTGQGLDALVAALGRFAEERFAGGETALLTHLRHRTALEAARAALLRMAGRPPGAVELVAEDLREAARTLAAVTGTIATEDVLGAIFARFCIGK